MGLTYKASNNAGNADLSAYFQGLTTLFNYPPDTDGYSPFFYGATAEWGDATVFLPVHGLTPGPTISVGHAIATAEGYGFEFEGSVSGTVGEKTVARYILDSVQLATYNIEDLFSEADSLTGNASNNVLSGYGGNDILDGSYGDDILFGGTGADLLIGGMGADYLNGGDGNDSVDYSLNSEGVTLALGRGVATGGDAEGDRLISIETLRGSQFDDRITGDGTDNRFFGNGGDDRLVGGTGDDFLRGGDGKDYLDGGAGCDTVDYASSSAAVQVNLATGKGAGGEAAGDTFVAVEDAIGSRFADVIVGSVAGNLLRGELGADKISGGKGDDTLLGGGGDDILTGGQGRDIFQFNALTTTGSGSTSGTDSIMDWRDGQDRISFVGSVVNSIADITIADGVDGAGKAIVNIFTADGAIQIYGANSNKFSANDFVFGLAARTLDATSHEAMMPHDFAGLGTHLDYLLHVALA